MDNVHYVIEKKSVSVSDNTKQVEGLSDLFNNLAKRGLDISKKMAKIVFLHDLHKLWIFTSFGYSRALDITTDITTAAATRNPKNVMSTLHELIIFYNTGKGLYLGKFVWFYFI